MTVRQGEGAAGYPPIIVLFGGPSAEHDVSIVSGTAIAEALMDAGLDVTQVVIDLVNAWWWLPYGDRRGDRSPADYDDPATLGASGPATLGQALDLLSVPDPGEQPVVFIALHGPFGEDGTVQAVLESIGIAYTGAGVLGSALGMDKVLQKRVWRGLGLPVIDWMEVRSAAWTASPATVLAQLEAFAGGDEQRLMVKPARLGSSVGMTLAHTADERPAALDLAFRYDDLAIVERYLEHARDLEVSVIGSEPITAYGPGEIVAGHEFYDYAAKYTPGLSETSTHAELPDVTRELMKKLARDAYRALGTEGFARVDFLVRDEEIYLSEINTIPGFTPISLFPTMPAEAGLDFTAVCLRILDLAIARHAARAARPGITPADLPR
ncbi:MAG TPA: D-alanine--D-alanine ligase family protein [Candidatus Limnocylindrales bacterium]|nr:D-alanine--D-alanine ligase family protein [Candidatus Limnocylindrales bacterium]